MGKKYSEIPDRDTTNFDYENSKIVETIYNC